MAVSNSGMTLYTDNDNESGWSGTDGADDYNNAIQGNNSESWQVSKNSTETATLNKASDLSGAKYFTLNMSSNLSPYYTDIKLRLGESTSNYDEHIIATSTDRKVSGDFHPIVAQLSEGTNTGGTVSYSAFDTTSIIVNNSSSGNIRSVINNWIDAMWYGVGRTIGGTTTSDNLFLESHISDTTTNDNYDGCSELYKGSLSYQTDVEITTTTGNSYGEVVNFAGGYNTDSIYKLTISGTANFQGTSIVGTDGAVVGIDSSSASSFNMSGGGITNGNKIVFGSGQEIDSIVLSSCYEIDTNGATFSNITINDTLETNTGALVGNSSTEINAMSNITFNNFTGKYALYIPASVTDTLTLNSFISDGSGTDIYWGGTSGTLTVNKSNGTNFTTSATAGGTIDILSSVSITIKIVDEGGFELSNVLVYVDDDLDDVGNIINTTTDINGEVTTSYSGSATEATIRARLYGYYPEKRVISLATDSVTNIRLLSHPQQT